MSLGFPAFSQTVLQHRLLTTQGDLSRGLATQWYLPGLAVPSSAYVGSPPSLGLLATLTLAFHGPNDPERNLPRTSREPCHLPLFAALGSALSLYWNPSPADRAICKMRIAKCNAALAPFADPRLSWPRGEVLSSLVHLDA